MKRGCFKYCFFWNTSPTGFLYFLFYLIALYNIICLIVDKCMDKKCLDHQSWSVMLSGASYSSCVECSTTWVDPGISLKALYQWSERWWGVSVHSWGLQLAWTWIILGGENTWYLWRQGHLTEEPRRAVGMEHYGILQEKCLMLNSERNNPLNW